ncbi:hypothetical protein BYT27DRAFT_7310551 [Phlegmacium glaucopus]|nr:hypothetical protein BYT27DRAFT_7310551 [Phlegmacium glaucopus]
MIKFATEYCLALDTITGKREMKLQKYELNDTEWDIAQQLGDILELLKQATLFFSQGTPNLATVIPAMDHLDQHLATSAVNLSLPPSIRAAATLGKCVLNKYYMFASYFS